MSLSSLTEINLDFSWVRQFFIRKCGEHIADSLDFKMLPDNSWILDITGEISAYCAKKWPNLNFVTFKQPNEHHSYNNLHVFEMTFDEFASNNNIAYDDFIVKNRIGYRRVIISNSIDNESILKQIDKQLYKDYNNPIQSLLIVYTTAMHRINGTIPHFKLIMESTDNKIRIYTFRPITDFNN
jgi:hypothetical protein